MSAIPKQKYTLEEYFELDRNSEANFEYFNGEVFEMSGVSPNHARIEHRLNRILGIPADKKDCEVFPANLRIKVPALPTYRYPDLSVACDGAKFVEIGGLQCLVNPVLIVEVLSESTAAYDQGEKFRLYKSIETFREYMLVSQDTPDVSHFLKHNERFWLQSNYTSGESLHVETLGFDLSVDEIYRGIEFGSEYKR
ncbi:MAG TPA: Uma2 family endonuclease [Pyrinomonadaceae bacterium]|jgi:Uma2 family endonuclease